jgi:pimeloyl-ACP methyl ester carboxylesterase
MGIEVLTLDGLRIAREVTGQGRPVLLLHGWGGRIESMAPLAASLAGQGYCAHTLDLPGFGRSDVPPQTPEAWGVAEYAACVLRYLDHAGLKPVRLIGHSFGGRIAIVIGAEHPAYVTQMVLTDSAGVRAPATAREHVVRMGSAALRLPGVRALEAPLRRLGRRLAGSEDLKAAGPLEATFRKVVAEDLLPRAARIQAPTLLIWGEQDQDTPLWQGRALEKAIPDAGLVVFQGAGHFAYQERLPEFVRIVHTFFGDRD